MDWLRIPASLGLIFLASFGTNFLSSAWERRRKRDDALDLLIAKLPGFNCGLCGQDDCRGFARWLIEKSGDPGLCAPGGATTEFALRALLGGDRAQAQVAFVRCGAGAGKATEIFSYDGRRDCAAAAACFQGQKACTASCLGFGTCVRACPIGAIRIVDGLARVDSGLCTGCGACVVACPTKVVALVPSTAHWQVACNSHKGAEEKKRDCSVPCTACGECERLSSSWEFRITGNLAQASDQSARGGQGNWETIAAHCPTRAISRDGLVPEPIPPAEMKSKKRP